MAKNKKKQNLSIPKAAADQIPYSSVTEGGLFEIGEESFSRIYKVVSSKAYDASGGLDAFSSLLGSFGYNDMQLSVFCTKKGRSPFITVNVRAESIESAEEEFSLIEKRFGEAAAGSGTGVSLKRLGLNAQLELIHYVCNNGKGSVKDKCGAISRASLKENRITTKDAAGPQSISFQKDYIETNSGFMRISFVNSFADHISSDFIKTISEGPAGSIITMHYHPVMAQDALSEIRKELKELEDTLKNPVSKGNKSPVYPNREEIRVKEGYTALLQDASDKSLPVYNIRFLTTLFADSKEELEEKTREAELKSTGSYFRVHRFDYQQDKAFQTVLPLANPKVRTGRIFSAKSAALFFPVCMTDGDMPLQDLNASDAHNDFYMIKAKTDKPQRKRQAIKRTVQETIPYVTAHWENGIIEMEPGVFSKMYRFTDINYHTATEQDQINYLEKYAQLLNRIDPTMRCQVILMNKNVNMDEFRRKNTLDMKGDGFDVYRKEYNAMIVSKMAEGRNNLAKERYFVVSTEAESIDAAKTAFNRIDPEIITAFKEIGDSKAETLTTPERLELLHDIYNTGHEGEFSPETVIDGKRVKAMDLETLCRLGITSKDLIAPSGFYFRRDWFRMGEKYCRVMYLTNLPNSLSDKFLSDLTGNNCNLIVSMNLKCMRQDKAVALTRRQLTNINVMVQKAQQTASKNGYSMELVPAEIKQAQEEANELLSGLTGSNQKMFMMTFTVMVYGNSMEELETNTDMIVSTGRKYLCEIERLNYQQEDGLATTLPLANNRLTITRTLTTNSTVIFIPFDVQELSQPHGMYYGQNASSHNLIIYDRKQAQNGNGWILGTPGSGKSFSAKREIANVIMNTDDDILIIDPEREYSPLVQAFGGSTVRIAPGSKWHLNPLDMDPEYGDDDDPIVLKSDFMISICETAVGGKYGLDPIQNSIIDRCVQIVYRDFVSKYNMDPRYTPTLLDFQKVLEAQPEMPAKELAIGLEIYTKGALDVFAHQSNVDINNRMVVYDIKDIGSSALRTLAYLVVLDNIWDRVIKNRRKGIRTWVYLDEVYILFEKEQSTNFIRQLFSRGRKYGCIMTALTQNVEPILANDVATTMLSNSAFVELLNQAPVDRDLLASLLSISPQQVSYINSAAPGHGLLYVQNVGLIPFADDFPRQICPELYKIMTSKPDELMEEFL